MGGARKTDSGSNSPVIGPKTKEENDVATKKPLQVKSDYKLGKVIKWFFREVEYRFFCVYNFV